MVLIIPAVETRALVEEAIVSREELAALVGAARAMAEARARVAIGPQVSSNRSRTWSALGVSVLIYSGVKGQDRSSTRKETGNMALPAGAAA